MSEEWLTLDDIAAELGVSKETVYGWRKKGTGPRGYRFGRHVRVRRRDFDAWAEQHADETSEAAELTRHPRDLRIRRELQSSRARYGHRGAGDAA